MSLLPAMAQEDEQRGVGLSGSIQTDILVPQEDTAIGADGYGGQVLSNTYADLLLTSRYVDAGMRLEYMEHPLPGFEADFDGWGLAHLFLTAHAKNMELTVGDFYEQFGSGLTLHTYEERTLGIDNSLRGARVRWQPFRGVSVKALAGRQRHYWKHNKAWTTGADVEVAMDEWMGTLRQAETKWSVGASAVNRHGQKDEQALQPADRLKNATLFGVRTRVQHGTWDTQAEWAHKTADPNAANDYSQRAGNALALTSSLKMDSLTLLMQVRRSDNIALSSESTTSTLASMINHQPAFIQEHYLALPITFPYATQMKGEWVGHVEVGYAASPHTLLGGRYGTSVKLNFSHAHSPKANGSFWVWGKETFYQDFNLHLQKRLTPSWSLGFMYMNQTYNQGVLEGTGGMMENNIYVLETDYIIGPKYKLRAEAQYMNSNVQINDELLALLEWSVGQQWKFAINYEYYPHDGQTHYPAAGVEFNTGAHALQVYYGRFSSGLESAGGICREAPSARGLAVSYTCSF